MTQFGQRLKMNLQMFARADDYPEPNLQDAASFENLEAKAVDYTYRFGENFRKFREALGVTRLLPVQQGFTVKMYTAPTVDLKDGNVGEGELIPLSKVVPQEATTKEITLDKFRKVTTIEAIQKYGGVDEAVNKTDEAMLKEVQKGIRDDLFDTIKNDHATEQENLNEGTLQGALATSWAALEELFEDDDIQVIAFVNPWDIATEIANKELTLENQFGLKYYTDVTGTVVFPTRNIDRGEVYSTVADNIQIAYISGKSDGFRAFNMVTDEFGFIGMAHSTPTLNNLTIETVMASGILMFPERLDGIVKVDVVPTANTEG